MSNVSRTAGTGLFISLIVFALLISPVFMAPALADFTANAGGPYTGTVGESIQFSGNAVTDGGTVVGYLWDFGDGTIGHGKVTHHAYLTTGEFSVSLTVSDDQSATASATTTATIDRASSTTTTSTTTTTTTTTVPPTTTTTTTTTTVPPTTTTVPPTTTTVPPTTEAAVTAPAEELSATVFSLAPSDIPAGREIAFTVTLAAEVPGTAAVQFLLDGQPLGEPATLNAHDAAVETATEAVFTRTLPEDIPAGVHSIDLVTTEQPPRVLASQTVRVVATASSVTETTRAALPATSTESASIVPIIVGGVAVVAAAGLGAFAFYRRKRTVRRLITKRW